MKTKFDIIRHGSENSLDVDIFVIVDKPYTNQAAKELCEEYFPRNANLIMIDRKYGYCSWCYKGTKDECNNAILATFDLHEQTLLENPIRLKVIRNKDEKVLRTIRGILSYYSRTHHRTLIKRALRTDDIDFKISVLKQIDYISIDNFVKNTKIEVYKFLAFQLGQTLALVENDVELFTKNKVIEYYPELKPYLMREENSNVTDLFIFLKRFIEYLEKWKEAP